MGSLLPRLRFSLCFRRYLKGREGHQETSLPQHDSLILTVLPNLELLPFGLTEGLFNRLSVHLN